MECGLQSIYDEFHLPLRRFILARVNDEAATDDILQEVYLRIHTHIDGLRDCSKLPAWVYQIARRTIVDHYRSRRTTLEIPEALPAAEDPCSGDLTCEVVSWLDPMINELPEKYRVALALTVREGLTQQEAAQRLGISLSGAKSRIQRGRDKIKDMLLACCHIEFDRYGGILDYQQRCCCCQTGRVTSG